MFSTLREYTIFKSNPGPFLGPLIPAFRPLYLIYLCYRQKPVESLTNRVLFIVFPSIRCYNKCNLNVCPFLGVLSERSLFMTNRSTDTHAEQANKNTRKTYNRTIKDSGAKLIFGDPILCAQFLRGYTDIELFKNVQPEDIEDITERFLPLWQEGRDSDTVKKCT